VIGGGFCHVFLFHPPTCGRVLLRIEDIDSPRVKANAAAAAMADLRWLGLEWDGEPVIQSARLPRYREALETLKARELVYPCTCTRTDIEQAASAPHAEHEGPRYPGTCANRRAADEECIGDRPYCWRFRVNEAGPEFDDLFRGPTRIDLREVGGDFVVWKMPVPGGGPSTPAYQLAVVVDDAEQGVTEVIRADDLIPSTPRQLLIYLALGLQPPRFCHVPLVVGPDGRRLAKRHGDTRLSALREAGVRPDSLLGLLAWSCGWLDAMRPVSLPELTRIFRLDTLPREPFVLQPEYLVGIGYEPGDAGK
jgi:glutamyl-tRNA synthetase